jgi:Ca-activated chloride channel family protein
MEEYMSKSNSVSIATSLDFDKVAYNKSNIVHLLVSLRGKSIDFSKRKPLSLAVSIDVSGSMQGQKIETAKSSLIKLIEHMTEQDSLAIFAFSDSVWQVIPMTKMTSDAKLKAKTAVSALQHLGSTNLSGATLEAYGALKDVMGEIQRAFLFTDGLPTAGVCDYPGLIEIAGRKPSEKVGLTTFGYGNDHDPELLTSMAKRGGGNFYFVKDIDSCAPFFGLELGGLLSCVAQTLKVKINATSGAKILEVMNDLDVEGNDDKTSAKITLDDIYSEEDRHILIKMELPEASKAIAKRDSKIATVEVSYHDVEAKKDETIDAKVKIEFVKPGDEQKEANKEVKEQLARVEAARAQDKAREMANKGDFDGAKRVIGAAVVCCRSAGTTFAKTLANELEHQVMSFVNDAHSYTHGGSGYLYASSIAYKTERKTWDGCQGWQGNQGSQGYQGSFSGKSNPWDTNLKEPNKVPPQAAGMVQAVASSQVATSQIPEVLLSKQRIHRS